MGAKLGTRKLNQYGFKKVVVSRLHALMQAIENEVAQGFASIGWEQFDDEEPAFIRGGPNEICFQVGMNIDARPQRVTFHPSLGVQHVSVSSVVDELMGQSPDVGACSVGIGLSDLLYRSGFEDPPYTRWTARSFEDSIVMVARFFDDLQRHGMEFFSRFHGLDDLIREMEVAPRYQELTGHLAVALALAGRREAASGALADYVEMARGQSGPLAAQSRRFFEGFVSRFSLGGHLIDEIRDLG